MEEWRDVVGYEGHYKVSDIGNVVSVKRSTPFQMKLQRHSGGYLQVALTMNGKPRLHYVHKLVLEAFVGKRPAGMEACHGDGVKTNNHMSNLRWASPSENNLDKRLHGTMSRFNGSANKQSKLDETVVRLSRLLKDQGFSCSELAGLFGVHHSVVRRAINKITWKHVA